MKISIDADLLNQLCESLGTMIDYANVDPSSEDYDAFFEEVDVAMKALDQTYKLF